MPYFFSDLADWTSMEYVGPGSGDTVIRGSLDDGSFTAFYVDPDSGKVTAALTVGRSDDLEHAKRFITEGAIARPHRAGGRVDGPGLALAGPSSCGAGTRTPITSSRGWRLAIRRPRREVFRIAA